MRRDSDMVLAGIPARLASMEVRVGTVEARQTRVLSDLAENTATTDRVEANTRHIMSFVNDVNAVWRVCKLIRHATLRVAKWITVVAGAFTAGIAALHSAGTIDVTKWFK